MGADGPCRRLEIRLRRQLSTDGKPNTHPPHQFYGRRRGHRLRPTRAALVANLLPRIRIDIPAAPAGLDPRSLFSGSIDAVWLEIGFGAGEHLAHQAAAHETVGMIGCEPFIDGVASLLARIDSASLSNVRIYDEDTRALLPALASSSIDRVFLLFNDPWPKKRHHRRRFVQPQMVAAIARILCDDGEFLFASDHAEYTRWSLRHTVANREFEWMARRPVDWREPPTDWSPTRYEAKARQQGVAPYFLRFRRRPRASLAECD